MGSVLLHLGRYQEAILHFRQACELRPDFPEAQRHLEQALVAEQQAGQRPPP